MLDFIKEGGVPSLVLLVYGAVMLIAAGGFAAKPAESKLPTLEALRRVMVYTIALGVLAGLYQVSKAAYAEPREHVAQIIIIGVGESLTIGILGFALLSVSYMLIAVGCRRLRA